MLVNPDKAFSSFSVDDIAKAKEFYSKMLGLKTSDQMGQLQLQLGQEKTVFVYSRPGNKPAEYTVLNFPVDDAEAKVKELKSRGVKFETYSEASYKTDADGICRNESGEGPKKIAWFKDPAGNILSLLEE